MRSSRLSLDITKLDENKTLSTIPTIPITSHESLLYHPLLVTSSSQRKKSQISNSSSTSTSASSSSIIFKTPGLNQIIEETKNAKHLRRSSSSASSSSSSSSSFSSYADTSSSSSSSSSSPLTAEITKLLLIPVSKDELATVESTTSLISSRAFHSNILDSLMNIDYNEENDDESVSNSKSSQKREFETDERLEKSFDKLSGYPTSASSSTSIYNNERNNEEVDVNFNGLNGLLCNTSIESLQAELKATQAVLKTLRSENSELRFAKSPTVVTPIRQAHSSQPPPPPPPPQITEEQEHYAEVLLAQAEAAKALALANASSALKRAAAMAKSSSINQIRIKEGIDNIYELVKEAIELVDNE
jgi:hypothetical protein